MERESRCPTAVDLYRLEDRVLTEIVIDIEAFFVRSVSSDVTAQESPSLDSLRLPEFALQDRSLRNYTVRPGTRWKAFVPLRLWKIFFRKVAVIFHVPSIDCVIYKLVKYKREVPLGRQCFPQLSFSASGVPTRFWWHPGTLRPPGSRRPSPTHVNSCLRGENHRHAWSSLH